MAQQTDKYGKRDYKHEFRVNYPWMSCSDEVLETAYKLTADMPRDLTMDLMKDYVLSNGLAEEVVL